MNTIVPIPKCALSIRLATNADIAFIDELQTLHQPMLGWTPKKTLEGKIAANHILIAEADARPVAYCISQDKYMGREDVGVIYQLNVRPVNHRSLIGATLVKTVFDRAAYGCRLFCCWCAQDIEANYFWESLGFVPLAFRAGNRKKARVHIFWQRRIREGDCVTPYWFPSETRGGMMNEARLVLPIPPGTHWKDAKPIVLPSTRADGTQEPKALPGEKRARGPRKPTMKAFPKTALIAGGLRFGPAPMEIAEKPKREKREKQPKLKNDPKHIAAARELRDRWLEEVNANPSLLLPVGKYEVSRALPDHSVPEKPVQEMRLIAA